MKGRGKRGNLNWCYLWWLPQRGQLGYGFIQWQRKTELMGEWPHEGICVCLHLHAWMRRCSRQQRQGNWNKCGSCFKIKCAKISAKMFLPVTWTEVAKKMRLSVPFSGCFCPRHISPCFTSACPGSLKKSLTVTGDSRKELLSQRFSSLLQPEACQAERKSLRASPKPHAHTRSSSPTCQLYNYTV